MKNILKITTLFAVLLTACNDGNEMSERELKAEMLATSWGHAHVTHTPGGDLSGQYTNFVIAFTGNGSGEFDGTYIISNGGYAFSESAGKWKFNDALNQIILDSGKEMDMQLEDDRLQLDFVTAPAGGKVNGLSGHFVFDLQPL